MLNTNTLEQERQIIPLGHRAQKLIMLNTNTLEQERQQMKDELMRGRALVLHRLFTESECSEMLKYAIAHSADKCRTAFDMYDGYANDSATGSVKGFRTSAGNKRFRNNQRIMLEDVSLAQKVSERLLPELHSSEFFREIRFVSAKTPGSKDLLAQINVLDADSHLEHFHPNVQGTWRPKMCAPNVRFYEYQNSQHFGPHYDGSIRDSDNDRSMVTVLIYLNGEDVLGGATNFVRETRAALYPDGKSQMFAAAQEDIIAKVEPATGKCLVFLHSLLHEGEQLQEDSGPKYVMRLDFMYSREADDRTAAVLSKTQEEAMDCLQKARELEAMKDIKAAIIMYKKVARLDPQLAEAVGV